MREATLETLEGGEPDAAVRSRLGSRGDVKEVLATAAAATPAGPGTKKSASLVDSDDEV